MINITNTTLQYNLNEISKYEQTPSGYTNVKTILYKNCVESKVLENKNTTITGEFEDGIYSVKFSAIKDGVVIQQIDCFYKQDICKVLNAYNKTKDSKILYMHYILASAKDCNKCDCSMLCELYSQLNKLINANDSPC